MKKICFIILIFFSITSYSQIYADLKEIVDFYGENYNLDESENFDLYIKYEFEEDFGEKWIMLGFIFLESGEKVCTHVHTIEPKSRINYWVNYYNNKGIVKIEEFIWRDYEKSITYEMEIFKTGVSIIKTPYFSE